MHYFKYKDVINSMYNFLTLKLLHFMKFYAWINLTNKINKKYFTTTIEEKNNNINYFYFTLRFLLLYHFGYYCINIKTFILSCFLKTKHKNSYDKNIQI